MFVAQSGHHLSGILRAYHSTEESSFANYFLTDVLVIVHCRRQQLPNGRHFPRQNSYGDNLGSNHQTYDDRFRCRYFYSTVQTFVYNSILLTSLEFNCTVKDFLCPLWWLLIDFNVTRNCTQRVVLFEQITES